MTQAKPPVDLIVETWSTDSEYNAGYDYACIRLTSELAQHLVTQMDWCAMLQKAAPTLTEIVFDEDDGLLFFESFTELSDLKDMDTGDPFDIHMQGSPPVLVTQEPVEIPEEWQRVGDMSRLIIEPDCVSWMTWPRHAEIRVYTVDVPRAVIEQFILPKDLT